MMQVKELFAVMEEQTARVNSEMHVVLGFEDDENYFSTWLPYLSDLDRPEYRERFIRSMWFDRKNNTLLMTVSGGIAMIDDIIRRII